MSGSRTEVLSFRLSTDEKRRLNEAVSRERALAEAIGQPAKSLSDWARERLMSFADDPAVFPGQSISITLNAPSTGANDVPLLAERIRRALELYGAGNRL